MNDDSEDDYSLFRGAMDFYKTQWKNGEDNFNHEYIEDGRGTDALYEIDRFVRSVESATDDKISKILNRRSEVENGNTSITKNYAETSRMSLGLEPDCIYSPYVELFRYAVFKIKPTLELRKQNDSADDFKEIVKIIRRVVKLRNFKKMVSSRKKNLEEGKESALNYVRELFGIYARLLVVRVDFHLKIPNASRVEQLRLAKNNLKNFLNSSRNRKFLKDSVGYIWKFEEGGTLGGHYHFIFFFDGAYFQKDEYIGWKIGEFWKKTTKGVGTFFNVNCKKYLKTLVSRGNGVGVGKVDFHDLEKRNNLEAIIEYFFKIEQYLGARHSDFFRTFGKGQIRSQKGVGGRPRKIIN